MSPRTNNTSGWVGWVYFAGIMLLIAAVFQGLFGVVALAKHTFYVVTPNTLAVYNYTAWGWAHIILAIILMTAGFSLLHGGIWGRVIAVIAAALSLLANLVFLPAYPIWVTAAVVIDALVLYAVLVHGGEADNQS